MLLLSSLGVLSCKDKPAVERPDAAPPRVVATTAGADVGAAVAEPSPWRLTGQLLGVASGRALILTDAIVSVDVDSGEVRARASTTAEEPSPSFDRHLPRFGGEDRQTERVDRIEEMPIYVGGEVVVFMRGSGDVVTSIVGLDATTLEEAWTLALAYKRPLRTCATADGVLLVPPSPDPARFVDWLGQQGWLREFGEPNEQVADIGCGATEVAVLLEANGRRRTRTFDGASGDLQTTDEAADELALRYDAPLHPVVRQAGSEVVGHIASP